MENKINEMGEEGVGSVCLMSMGILLGIIKKSLKRVSQHCGVKNPNLLW